MFKTVDIAINFYKSTIRYDLSSRLHKCVYVLKALSRNFCIEINVALH